MAQGGVYRQKRSSCNRRGYSTGRNLLTRTRQYDPGWTREKAAGEIPKAPSKIQQRKSQLHPFCRRLSHYWHVQRCVRRRGETACRAIYERTRVRTFTRIDPHHTHWTWCRLSPTASPHIRAAVARRC